MTVKKLGALDFFLNWHNSLINARLQMIWQTLTLSILTCQDRVVVEFWPHFKGDLCALTFNEN